MTQKRSFLGTGWSFPPQFDNKGVAVSMLSDVDDINSSLEILLSTRQGERVMQPGYGCNLDEMVFEPLTTSFKTYIRDLVTTAILYYEPRISVNNIELDDTEELQGKILVRVEYTVRSTNSRFNFVFPYYKTEGTEIIK